VDNRNEVVCLDLNGMANGNDGPYREEDRHMAPRGEAPIEVGSSDADIIWLYDMPRELGVHNHDAAHCSVLVHGPFVYVTTGNGVDNTHRKIRAPDAPSLIALDKGTGRLVARDTERMGPQIIHSQWASPSLGEVNGRNLVFFGGGDGVVYAFEALAPGLLTRATGAPLELRKVWRFDCDPTAPKENIHQWQDNRREGPSNISGMPVVHQDCVYVTAGGDLWHGKPQAWLKRIDATKSGDITKSGEKWSYRLGKHCLSTPAIQDGLVYITDCACQIHCVDAETGRPCWVHQVKGEIWGSSLVADGKVFVGTERREFVVLAAGKEKKLLGSLELDSAISGTPVAANGALYVTTMTRLYALRKTAK
jgi:outer membrane protein assembly factor BamB